MSWKRISLTILEKFNILSDADRATDISKSADEFRSIGKSSFILIDKVENNEVDEHEIILNLSDEETTCEKEVDRSNSVKYDDTMYSNLETVKLETESEKNVSMQDENVTLYDSERVIEDVFEDNIKRDQKMRVDELIESEKTYVNQLQHIVRYYIPSLKAEWGVPHTLTLLQPEDVFCNIKEIYKFHKKIFLPALIEARHDVKAIGNVFIKNIDSLLLLYEIYSNKKNKCDKIIEEHSNFFKQKQEECYDDFDVSTYITTPFQRITRYPIFLQSMAKNCQKLYNRTDIGGIISNSTKEDMPILEVALESVEDLLKILNKKSTLLAECFGLKDLKVISELQGMYVRHNIFKVSDSRNHRRLMTCFLFEKCLILATKLHQKVLVDEMFRHYDTVPMKCLGFILPVNEESNYLTILYPDNTFKRYILEGEVSVTNKWILDVNQILCQQLNNELYRDLYQQFKIFYDM